MLWLLAAPIVSKAVQRVVMLVAALGIALLLGMPMLGILVDPWAPFRLSGQGATLVVGGPAVPAVVDLPLGSAPGPQTIVSDLQRYLLAIGAGFTPTEAIIATAISIAENGAGNPSALSGANFDGSRDLGLWQINSAHWPQYGGQAALVNPVNNVIAAFAIYRRQGWCAWSTYEASCGVGHNSSYAAFMSRARAAAAGVH